MVICHAAAASIDAVATPVVTMPPAGGIAAGVPSGAAVAPGWGLALALVAAAVLAVLASRVGGLRHERAILTASARALLQLGGLAFVLAAVLASGWLTAGVLLLMLGVAAATSAGRIVRGYELWRCLVAIGLPAGAVRALVVGLRAGRPAGPHQ